MHARLLRIRIKVDQIDEASKLFEEKVIPLCRSQKGFMGAYFMSNKTSGDCIPITLWESEEDMIANEENRFFQEQIVKFMKYFSSPPVRETYEIVVED
jgi:hypothetical protein